MSPSDRKVVHDTVNDIEGLETSSEGVEPRRYVVIRSDSATAQAQVASATDEVDEVDEDVEDDSSDSEDLS
jgi:hypothetical protein